MAMTRAVPHTPTACTGSAPGFCSISRERQGMRLYRGQVARIASEIIQTLRRDNDIEVEDTAVPEAEKDLVAIMDEYLKRDQKIVEEAKDIVDMRNLTHSDFGRVKRELCEQYGHPVGE